MGPRLRHVFQTTGPDHDAAFTRNHDERVGYDLKLDTLTSASTRKRTRHALYAR